MKRKLTFALAMTCLVAAPFAAVAQAPAAKGLLEVVPGEAWGLVSVRSLAEFDKKVTNLAMEINAPMAGMSMLAMAKGHLGLLAGVNDEGSLGVVVMPAETAEAVSQSLAILVPVSGYTDLLSMLSPEDAGDGISKILFMGNETYAAEKSGYAVLGPSPELVKTILQGKSSLSSQMTAHEQKRWAQDDFAAWGHLSALTASPVWSAIAEPMNATGMDLAMLEDFKSAGLSVRLGAEGITFGYYVGAKQGTAMASALNDLKVPSNSLLTGLPAEEFAFAMGKASNKAASELGGKILEQIFAALAQQPEAPPFVAKLQPVITEMITSLRTVSFGVNGLAEGADGTMAVTCVIGVDGGAEQFLSQFGQLFDELKAGMATDEAPGLDDFVHYIPKAEGDASHLKFHPAAMGADEADVTKMTQLLGKDVALVRMSPAGAEHVVVTVGGGAAHLDNVVGLVQGGKSPLTEHAEVKAVASMLPAGRFFEGYLSPNGVMKLAGAIAKATDGGALPNLPPVEKPVAMYSAIVPQGGAQTDILIPMDLIKALMQMAMAGMGGGPAGPGEPVGTEPPPM